MTRTPARARLAGSTGRFDLTPPPHTMNTPELDTLAANIRHAIRSRDHTEIGGGFFTPDDLQHALHEIDSLRAALRDQSAALVQAIEAAGFAVAGPTDHRAAEHGEPAWICNARAVIAQAQA